jgi:4-diphosphocytidyl-2-C-methyl-D-erythritol kinase
VISADGAHEAAQDGNIRAASVLRDVARAKVNLTLKILGRRPDGYHELESLVAFTRFGDVVELETGQPFSLDVQGPFASAIDGGNLIRRAAEHYARHPTHREESDTAATDPSLDVPAIRTAAMPGTFGAFRLDKQIPVAAGLGGGSADAAAALRLLAGLSAEKADGPAPALDGSLQSNRRTALLPLARELGADVPVCLFSKPAIMTGIGQRIRLIGAFPALPIVLVNPRLPLSTAAVFRELKARPLTGAAGEPSPLPALTSVEDIVRYADARSNDLEPPARRLLPMIDTMLDALAACPGVLLARLSGSGPTCFALFGAAAGAEAAAERLSDANPDWWVRATTLG